MAKDFNVGDRIYFGRTNGDKTLGEVVKVNRSKLKVKALEPRGKFSSGDVWNVSPMLCTHAEVPIGDAESILAVVASDRGWTEATMLNVALRFIDELGGNARADFKNFLAEQA